jgi:subtilase family serine protease
MSDLDGDGDQDLLVAGDAQAFGSGPHFGLATALINRGDGTFEAESQLSLATAVRALHLGDLDGDGQIDLTATPADSSLSSSVAFGHSPLRMKLLDASGQLLALGTEEAPITSLDGFEPAADGEYFLRVDANSPTDYALLVTRNAQLEREPNQPPSEPVDLSTTGQAVGHLAGLETAGVIHVGIVGRDSAASAIRAFLQSTPQFDFDVDAVDPEQILSPGALQPFDVVIMTQFSFSDLAAIAAATRSYVEAGGGLITLGETSQFLSTSSEGIADFDVVIPVSAASFDDSTSIDGVSIAQPDHPIFSAIASLAFQGTIVAPTESAIDPGATTLAATSDARPLIVQGTAGLGRTLWTALPPAAAPADPSLAQFWQQTAAYIAGGGADEFDFHVLGGETLIISTTLPGIGSRADETLDPRLELYNSLGFLVASDDNSGGDGRNALVIHSVPANESGTYRLVVGRASGEGDYGLSISGVTLQAAAAARVVEVTPDNLERLANPPRFIDLTFDRPILASSLDLASVTIDGGATVTGVALVDGRTVRVSLDIPAAATVYHYSLANGALTDLAGRPTQAFAGAFEVDHTGPRVIAQSPATQAAAPFTSWTFTFDEPLSPNSYRTDVVKTLVDPFGSNINFAIRSVTGSGNTLVVEFAPRSSLGTYTITLDSTRIADVAGNALDQDASGVGGEPADDYTSSISLQSMDLTPEIFEPAAGSAQFGDPLSVRWTVRNIGGDPAVEGWTDRIWLSLDDTLDRDDDIPLGDFAAADVAPLSPDATYTQTRLVTLPLSADLAPGSYRLIVETDSDATQGELSETNNLLAAAIDLALPPLPDLAVTSISLPDAAFSNQSIEVTWTVSNLGAAPATGSWTDQVFISPTADGTGQFMGAFDFTGTIPAGGAVSRTQSIFIPFNLTGEQFALVTTDATNTVFEHAEEGNNTAASAAPIEITQSLFPDLRVESVTATATDVLLDTQPFTVQWLIRNAGTGATSAPFWKDGVYLSADAVLDATDIPLKLVGNQSFLAAGEAYSSSAAVTATGVSDGEYFVLVKADATAPGFVDEFISEGNNVGIGPRIRVHSPPLPDLIVTNVAAPPLSLSGQRIDVAYAVRNVGPGSVAASTWFDDVYLSTDSLFDGGDLRLGRFLRNRNTSLGGASGTEIDYTGTVPVTLPLGISGTFFVLVLTDSTDRVEEFAFEGNNFAFDASPLQVVLTPPPDLVVESVAAPAAGVADHAIDVSYTVANRGATPAVAASWRDSIYLSADDVLDANDVLLRNVNIYLTSLEVDGSYVRETTVTLPGGISGDYFLIAATDRGDDVFELDNANNVRASAASISIAVEPPDLVVSGLTVSPSVVAGGELHAQWTVLNAGPGDTVRSSWIDSVYLSADDSFGNEDDRLVALIPRFGALAPSGSYFVERTFTVPFDLEGTFHVFVATDAANEIAEFSGEENNASDPAAVAVSRSTADLAVSSPTVANAHGRLLIGWTVTNLGDNTTNSNFWSDAVVASANDVYGDADDVELFRYFRGNKLAPTESYAISRFVSVPEAVAGMQRIFIVTDAAQNVDEHGVEGNNVILAATQDIDALRTNFDLVVDQVDAPDEAISGQPFILAWTVRNYGAPLNVPPPRAAEVDGDSWIDNIYLSHDQVFDPAADVFVGQAAVDISAMTTVAEAGQTFEEYHASTEFRVPAGLTGPWYVFVRTDRNNSIVEHGAEDNNVQLDAAAMFVSLAPPVDLVAGEITLPPDATVGSPVLLTYTIHNDGDTSASGEWTDRLYLSRDNVYSPDDVRLLSHVHGRAGLPPFPSPILPGGSESFDVGAALPPIVPGEYFVVLRSDIFNQIPEASEANNLRVTIDRISIDLPELSIDGGSATAQIDEPIGFHESRSHYYRFEATDGQTIRFDAQFFDLPNVIVPDPSAPNGTRSVAVPRQSVVSAYLAFGRVPTEADYDYGQNNFLLTFDHSSLNTPLTLPRARTGTYYLRIDVRDNHATVPNFLAGHERFDVALTVLPFQVTSIEANAKGNVGPATTEVVASNFTPCTSVQLVSGGAVVRQAEQITRISTDSSFVTIDYAGLAPGDYELRVTDPSGVNDSETVTVSAGTGARVGGSLGGPGTLRRGADYLFYARYGNSGDVDGVAPLLMLEQTGNYAWGLTRETRRPQARLQLLGISLDGPAGVLRPGELGSAPVYFSTSAAIGVPPPPQFALHVITADDARPLLFDEIESQIRPTDISDEAWAAIRPALIARLGPTWGTYVRALAAAATSLANQGTRSSDVRILLTELLRQIADPFATTLAGVAVTGEGCVPIARPTVQAIAANGTTAVAVSLEDGRFSFPGLPAGAYTLVADAPGRGRVVVSDVIADSAAPSRTIVLPVESVITGHALVGPGHPQDFGMAVEATLRGAPLAAAAHFSVGLTGLDFALRGLPAGTYDLTLRGNDVTETKFVVTVGAGETVDAGGIDLTAKSIINGSVQVSTGTLSPLTTIVQLLSGSVVVASAPINSAGEFDFLGLDEGDYSLQAKELSQTPRLSTIVHVTLAVGEAASDVHLSLGDGGTVIGTIRDAATSDPLTSVPVMLVAADGASQATFTDSSGRYRFEALAPGDYVVALPGGDSAAVEVSEVSGEEVAVDLTYATAATLTGVVTDAAGAPLQGVTIALSSNGHLVLGTRTDSAGHYTFRLAAAGTFDLTASFDGASFLPATNIVVADGAAVSRDFSAGNGSIVVTVTGPDGTVAGSLVVLRQVVNGADLVVGTKILDETQTATFASLVAGDYRIEVSSVSRRGARATVTVAGSTPTGLVVPLLRFTPIAGHVLSSTAGSIASGEVTLVSMLDPNDVRIAPILSDGSYSLPLVAPGNYSLVTIVDGFQTDVQPLTISPNEPTLTLDVTLAASDRAMSGRAVDALGRSLSSGTAALFDALNRLVDEAAIGADGQFTLRGASGAGLRLVVSSLGFQAAERTGLSLSAGATIALGDVTLANAALSEGTGQPPNPFVSPAASAPAAAPPAVAAPSHAFSTAANPLGVAPRSSPAPLAGAAPAASGAINDFGFVIPAIISLGTRIYDYAADIPRRADEVTIAQIPDRPAGACNACAQSELDAVNAEIAQHTAFDVVHSRDNNLDLQLLGLPAIFGLEIATDLGAIATLVLAGYQLAAAAGVGAIGAGAAAALEGVSGITSLGFTISQTLPALDGFVNFLLDFPNSASAEDLLDRTATAFNQASNLTQLITVVVDSLNAVLLSSEFIAIASQSGGAVGNLVGIAANFMGAASLYANTFTLTATRDQLGLIIDAKSQRNTARDSYFYEVDFAKFKLAAYQYCLTVNAPIDSTCDFGSGAGDASPAPGGPPAPNPPGLPLPPVPPTPPSNYIPSYVLAHDPNEIVGPQGFGEQQWVAAVEPLSYTIRFENIAEATAPATRITITQQLDEDFDFQSFRVDDFGFGDTLVELPGKDPFFQGRLALSGSSNVVDVIATVDILTGLVTWILQTIDPTTGEAPIDALAGFLPPNDPAHRGEGFVSYTVRPKRTTPTDTRVDAHATIVFDVNEPLDTPSIFNTLDVAPPASAIAPLPAVSAEEAIAVRWTAADDADGSAIAGFDIYVSRDGRPFEPWLVATTLTTATYFGLAGHTYAFYSVASDNAGNIETPPTAADATTSIAFTGLFGDLNLDGAIGASDAIILRDHLGKDSGATYAEGDLTGDRAVTREDLAALVRRFGEAAAAAPPDAAAASSYIVAPQAPAALIVAKNREASRRIAARRRAVDETMANIGVSSGAALAAARSRAIKRPAVHRSRLASATRTDFETAVDASLRHRE